LAVPKIADQQIGSKESVTLKIMCTLLGAEFQGKIVKKMTELKKRAKIEFGLIVKEI
jgi:hypothetical protein